MGLSNVFGNPSRERVLASALKKVCSSVRNAFRQDVHLDLSLPGLRFKLLTIYIKIRDSIIGDHTISLAEFTFYTANKYRRGQFDEDMGVGITIHNVLLVSHICVQLK